MGKKNKNKKLKGLTIQFMPYSEIETLMSGARIRKLLDVVLKNRLVILQGKLFPEEETRLIEDTMAMVGHIKHFKGIELAVLNPNSNGLGFWGKMRHGMARALGAQEALTIIGPASIVREMKRDPKKIEILMNK